MRTRRFYTHLSARSEMVINATRPPFKEMYYMLNSYCQRNGNRMHPLLGDLLEFADEVEALWNHTNPNNGENLIVGFIRNQFTPLQNNEEMVLRAEVGSGP